MGMETKCPFCGKDRPMFRSCAEQACAKKEKEPMDPVSKWILIICIALAFSVMFYLEVISGEGLRWHTWY